MIVKKYIISILCGKPFLQLGVAFLPDHVVDGIGQCLGGAHDNADFLCPGDTRIDKVPLKHHEMGHQQWDDHHGLFSAL